VFVYGRHSRHSRIRCADKDATKYTKDGPGTKGGQSWTPEWLKFDNSYFKEVKAQMDPDLLVLQTDDVIFKDEGFAPFANKYEADNDAFFVDYAKAHKKLSELGVTWDDGTPLSI
jgi:L-ascorbate peroxidase